MINKTVVLDGDCQLIIPEDGELGVISAIRKPYPPYTGDTIVTPSDSIQVLNTELTTLTDNIIVNPVPGDYVGADIPRRDDDDLTASGATVTAPAGYYEESASKTVPSGTEGTPTATKSAVSNHSVSVTPSVTNAAGYISGGTKTGEPVTVTASELESGTKSITANGEGIDVTGYAAVDVDVPSSEPTLQTITKTYTPSTSQQTETVTASAGYDGIEEVDITVNAMPTGTAGTPTATKGTVSNHSISVTPTVTNGAGYIPGGTKTGTPVTVSASELDSGAKAITANGNGQDVVGYASVNVSVPNSYTASDEGKVVNNGALTAQTSATYTDNGTYDTTLKNSVTVNVSGGGGASNVVFGSFTTRSTDGVQTVEIPYEGSGYPIYGMIVVHGGIYDPANTDWYNLVRAYAVGMWSMAKDVTSAAPTFSGNSAPNMCAITGLYKSSASSPTVYTSARAMDYVNFKTGTPAAASATSVAAMPSKTKINLMVTSNTNYYTFVPNTEYDYIFVYSE